jgi:hypothetical protein
LSPRDRRSALRPGGFAASGLQAAWHSVGQKQGQTYQTPPQGGSRSERERAGPKQNYLKAQRRWRHKRVRRVRTRAPHQSVQFGLAEPPLQVRAPRALLPQRPLRGVAERHQPARRGSAGVGAVPREGGQDLGGLGRGARAVVLRARRVRCGRGRFVSLVLRLQGVDSRGADSKPVSKLGFRPTALRVLAVRPESCGGCEAVSRPRTCL